MSNEELKTLIENDETVNSLKQHKMDCNKF